MSDDSMLGRRGGVAAMAAAATQRIELSVRLEVRRNDVCYAARDFRQEKTRTKQEETLLVQVGLVDSCKEGYRHEMCH